MALKQLQGNDIEIQFIDKVLHAPQPVIVEFYKSNSGLSFLAESLLQEFTENLQDKLKFYKINIDEHPFFSVAYNLQEVPTLLLFVNGAIHGYIGGTFSRHKFVSTIIDKLQLESRL